MAETATSEYLQRLRPPMPSASVKKGLDLPLGCVLYSDTVREEFLVIRQDRVILTRRKWEQVSSYKHPGRTLSFVVRHDLSTHVRFGRPAPCGTEALLT